MANSIEERILELIDRAGRQDLSLPQLYQEWPEQAEGDRFLEQVYDDLEDFLEHWRPGEEVSANTTLRLDRVLLLQDLTSAERTRRREEVLAAAPTEDDFRRLLGD
ncbi:MAG TPA: hypothetical protein VHQ65_16390 [Thermoanaerobaculia bacterium]|nr:hypothetical protein [Thermoanaerobaculia bacterium]